MLPIYNAFVLEEKKLEGGSTRPILVSVDTGNGISQYVVKIFTEKQNQQYSPLANEIYCNKLAKAFDISTPDIALISFDENFISTLPEDLRLRTLNQKPLFFGSKYHDGYVQYIPAKHHRTFDCWDIELIFAFDVLVRNVDRRNGKPNLLVNNMGYIAIDHELCLSIYKTFDEFCKTNDWNFIGRLGGDQKRTHIFKSRLHRIFNKIDFAVITEYVRVINIEEILSCAEFLHSHDLTTGNIDAINVYFREIKNNPARFIQLCKLLIA